MVRQNRRTFIQQISGATGAAFFANSTYKLARATPATRPNILFMMADDHARQAISCYGSRINQTPNIDRIAAQGMRFENCFCTNSICAPSRAVILTGKYSHLNGVTDNSKTFDGTQMTFPKLLQEAGYQTAMMGKWHLKSDPTGFDYWNILPGQGDYHNPETIRMGERLQHNGYVTDIITDESLNWLKQRDPNKPFLLMCHHKAPHMPWEAKQQYERLYDDDILPEPITFDDDTATRCEAIRTHEASIENHLNNWMKWDIPNGLTRHERKQWLYQQYIKTYLRSVASVDENVGRLLAYLDEEGLSDNTIVVYTSDQGFFLGEHGLFDKRFMYEEALGMPLLVRYPNRIAPHSVNRDMVLNLDFAPTFLDLAGVPIPKEMQGRSFQTLLAGTTPEAWQTSMYYRYFEDWLVTPHEGIRTLQHKLIHFEGAVNDWELYDLSRDPFEMNNVYSNPEYSDTVNKLKQYLNRLKAHFGDK